MSRRCVWWSAGWSSPASQPTASPWRAFQATSCTISARMPAALSAYKAALAAAASETERCRALIGLAAVKRIIDDLDGAFADLDDAQRMATAAGLTAEQARIHYLRGNLYFPRGDMEGCLREHGRSLELSREAGAAEQEAAALGGLGDAEYVRGRMVSAHEAYGRCVELCRLRGLGRIEIANRPMVAFTRWFVADTRDCTRGSTRDNRGGGESGPAQGADDRPSRRLLLQPRPARPAGGMAPCRAGPDAGPATRREAVRGGGPGPARGTAPAGRAPVGGPGRRRGSAGHQSRDWDGLHRAGHTGRARARLARQERARHGLGGGRGATGGKDPSATTTSSSGATQSMPASVPERGTAPNATRPHSRTTPVRSRRRGAISSSPAAGHSRRTGVERIRLRLGPS